MTQRFADWAYSTEEPNPHILYDMGFRAVGRYIGVGSAAKHLTPDEITYLHGAGLGIVGLVEGSIDAPFVGDSYQTGQRHARAAVKHARTLGFPNGCILVFAYDRDTVAGNINKAVEYANGVENALRPTEYGAGAYGDLDILTRLRHLGFAHLFFKAAADAWDHGLPMPPWVHLDQQRNGQHVAGGIIDIGTMQNTTPGIWYPTGDDMLAPDEKKMLTAISARVESLTHGTDTIDTTWSQLDPDGHEDNWTVKTLKDILRRIEALETGNVAGQTVTGTFTGTIADAPQV